MLNNKSDLASSVTFKPPLQAKTVPPNITALQLINDGKEGFAAMYANMYYIAYSSFINQSDIIGNISSSGVHWQPEENNTDPPSHFVLVDKDLAYNCTFYPVFDTYSGMFAMAWIENNVVGRLNLKYSETATIAGGADGFVQPVANAEAPETPGINETIYVRPSIEVAQELNKHDNIPLNDVRIIDLAGNEFTLNAYHQHRLPFGYEMALPKQIKAVKFSQVFKDVGATLECVIGTAPIAGTATSPALPSMPLSNIKVNIYYGDTDKIFQTLYSDANGKMRFNINRGRYVFEIVVNTPSINFSQRFV